MKEDQKIKNLLDQLANDDERAFRQLFHFFSDKVYSFAYRLTRSETVAEEMVQEVFLKVWINRASLSEVSNFSAFLLTITKNQTFNILKRQALEERAKLRLLREFDDTQGETEEAFIMEEHKQLLNQAINHLPPQQRLVYSMCHQEGLRYEEVAQRLKISKLTVKTHMQQALRNIKSQFLHIARLALVFFTFDL